MLRVEHSDSQATGKEYTKEIGKWDSLSVSNDHTSTSLTFVVTDTSTTPDRDLATVTVLAGETFDDIFPKFNKIVVNSTVAYRIILREDDQVRA